MNPEERLRLFRASVPKLAPRHQPRGLYRASTGEPGTPKRLNQPRPAVIKPGRYHAFGTGFSEARNVKWLKRPDKAGKKAPKPRKGLSPLTKIAMQLPMKLKKIRQSNLAELAKLAICSRVNVLCERRPESELGL